MNRNALTEQRRETVIGLLKSMNIKKSNAEGFDKDDVYDCMQQICDLYEKNIEELENAYEGEINQLKERYQKYDENNELYISLIMEAKKSSNEIITQAKTEVETILEEGKEKVAVQEQELAQMRADMEVEKQAMIAELNAAKDAVEAEKAAMRADLEAEKEKTTATKNKYTQQLNSMEEEFEEIKTNILRTAGKIDSLKSKLPNDDDVEWQMNNELEGIGFPAQEVAVESIFEEAPVSIEGAFAIEDPVAIEESVAATETIAVAEPVVDAPIFSDAPVFTEAPEETTFTLDDIMADSTMQPQETVISEEAAAPVEELNLEDIEIDLPVFGEAPMFEEASSTMEAPQTSADEISFEGLEELFKED